MTFDSLRNNPDIIRIANKAAAGFRGYLSKTEIESCILIAIWKAVSKYDPKFGLKISTFIYKGVRLECRSLKQQNDGNKRFQSLYYDDGVVDKRYDNNRYVDMYDELSAIKNSDLAIRRYVDNTSIKQLADEAGLTKVAIRKKIQKVRAIAIGRDR